MFKPYKMHKIQVLKLWVKSPTPLKFQDIDYVICTQNSRKSYVGYCGLTLWVSRVLKYPIKCLEDLTTFFMSIWSGESKNMEEIEFSLWLFEDKGRAKKCCPMGWIGSAILQVAQKAIVRIQFLSYFWNPLIK